MGHYTVSQSFSVSHLLLQSRRLGDKASNNPVSQIKMSLFSRFLLRLEQ